jgi:hypothetical protein
VLSADLYLINAFKPLFRDQDSLISHFRAHIRPPVKSGVSWGDYNAIHPSFH